MNHYSYEAYGLRVCSAIEIPELPPATHAADASEVDIGGGDVPTRLEPVDYEQHDATSQGENYLIISEGRVLLNVDGVGRYLVEGGTKVTIDPEPGASEHEIRVFLLGTCVGAILHQRGAFVLHASGIGTEQGAVLFAGRSGAGKSTLLAEFLERGYRMLVDDVCAVRLESNQLIVAPSYPRTRVWSDTAAEFQIDTTGLQPTLSDMAKFERQLPDQFWPTPLKPRAVFELIGPSADGMTFTPLSPMEALPRLISHTYRKMMLDALGIRRHHFDLASAVASTVPIFRVTRPQHGFSVAAIADRIVTDLELAPPS